MDPIPSSTSPNHLSSNKLSCGAIYYLLVIIYKLLGHLNLSIADFDPTSPMVDEGPTNFMGVPQIQGGKSQVNYFLV